MNLTGLEADLYRRLGFDTAPATAVTTRMRGFLNETQREILSSKGCAKLRKNTLTFPSIANQPFATLPASATKIISIQDRTNQWELREISLEDIRRDDPGLVFTGVPYTFAVINVAAAVYRDPTAAAELFVQSSSAADGATKTVYIEGIVTGGTYRTASVALNGVTAVSLSATIADWIAVTKFYIALGAGGATTAAGNILLTQTSGLGTELARITPGRSYGRYTRIMLYPVPTAAQTYYADVELHIEDMAIAGDEPYLPEDYSWLLVSGALMKEYQRRQWPVQYAEEKARYKDGLGQLKLFIMSDSGTRAVRDRMGYSQLGSWYPPGS